VRRCPDPDCRHRIEHGRAAEYQDDVERCPECGARLTDEEPTPQVVERRPVPRRLWLRLLVTIGVPLGILPLERVTVPGTDPDLIAGFVAWGGDPAQLSVLGLGLVPILAAYTLVEIVALLVPRWRWMRVSGPYGRRRLELAVAIVAAVLALAQGSSVALWLGSRVSVPITNLGLVGQLAITVTLAAGTMLLWLAARVIGRHGLGNGFSVLLAALTLPAVLHALYEMWMSYRFDALAPASLLLSLAAQGALVWLVWWMLRARAGRLRSPASGLTPIEAAATLLMLPATLGNLTGATFEWFYPHSLEYVIAEVVLVAGGAVGFAVLYNRPSRVVAAWAPLLEDTADPVARARAGVREAILPAATSLVLLVVAHAVVMRLSAATSQLSLLLLVVAVAVILDVAAEWRARRYAQLVAVWPVHRVYAVDPAIEYLSRHGIEAFPRAVRHRTLLQFFGPFVPVELLVREADAERAFELMRAAHGPR
jgi:hypothetical protein